MANVSMPRAGLDYFPGGGNSMAFITPGGINCIASRMAYSELTSMFSLIWDEACTVDLPKQLAEAVANTSTSTWPHTWIVPKYATMVEYKQFAPANHLHAVWDLPPAPAILDGYGERAIGDAFGTAAAVDRGRRPAIAVVAPAQWWRNQHQECSAPKHGRERALSRFVGCGTPRRATERHRGPRNTTEGVPYSLFVDRLEHHVA